MAVTPISPHISLNLFTASKHIRFLESLKPLQFTGQLIFTEPKGQKWSFYLYLGRILYATGGAHSVRRWQRYLEVYCPQLLHDRSAILRDLSKIESVTSKTCWQYQLLCLWQAQHKINNEQVGKLIPAIAIEVLFDIAQARHATYQIQPDNKLSSPLAVVDIEEAIAEAEELWQAWRNDSVGNYSPNQAPVITDSKLLQHRTSAQVYQSLTKLLDGKRTLRDLAVLLKRDVLQLTRSFLPYIELGLVELIDIPDLPTPVDTPVPQKPDVSASANAPLVACVDDSPIVCKTMESLLTAAGYRYVGVQDGLRAIAVMLTRKPDVIFLDLVMPNTNGYEICAQLRKLPHFRNTPILILTGNDGIVDRVRAKLVGASDFLNKPVDAGVVLSVIRKHLEQGASRVGG